MKLPVKIICPLGAECITIKDGNTRKCAWYVRLQGQNPQTGEVMDEDGCALTWLPVLLIENSRASINTSAAVESFRNETTKATNDCISAIVDIAQRRLAIGR